MWSREWRERYCDRSESSTTQGGKLEADDAVFGVRRLRAPLFSKQLQREFNDARWKA
jgi:hypothetical protein